MCFSKHPPSNHERVEKKRERPPTEEHNERTQMIDEEAEAVRDQLCLMATQLQLRDWNGITFIVA
jgi:hypothetical protein